MPTTWTTQSRNPISYDAPPPQPVVGEAYELLIGGGFKLNIGDGFNLTIKPASTPIQYTHVNKSQGANNWPDPDTLAQDYFLNIGDGYNLLISPAHKLIVDPDYYDTPWETITRNPNKF